MKDDTTTLETRTQTGVADVGYASILYRWCGVRQLVHHPLTLMTPTEPKKKKKPLNAGQIARLRRQAGKATAKKHGISILQQTERRYISNTWEGQGN